MKPTLVIMAAGMGSRFGGMKQMAAVDGAGQVICEYSIFDAARAGFEEVVVIIKPEMETDFEERIGHKVRQRLRLRYAFQTMDMLPPGYSIPPGREKPWGTAHAVLCAKDHIAGDFAVINADDFYGYSAYQTLFHFLCDTTKKDEHAMVAYLLKNTVTENGSVARGVCEVDGRGLLRKVTERLRIEKRADGIAFTEDGGASYTPLAPDTTVSMNFFGYRHSFLSDLEKGFADFLQNDVPHNPLKAEALLPRMTDTMIGAGKMRMRVLQSADSWHGVTYREDLPAMQAAIEGMRESGKYPLTLF
ncbi:MAG: NTP transferase domain-containing protein [Clostridiales bacterium]|nr:NTP transferase domain-containing protein [Clostridiales bacterium]